MISSDMNLPYTKAVIQEAFRIETAVPLSVPRRTRQDVKLMSYLIPKNTQVSRYSEACISCQLQQKILKTICRICRYVSYR